MLIPSYWQTRCAGAVGLYIYMAAHIQLGNRMRVIITIAYNPAGFTQGYFLHNLLFDHPTAL